MRVSRGVPTFLRGVVSQRAEMGLMDGALRLDGGDLVTHGHGHFFGEALKRLDQL